MKMANTNLLDAFMTLRRMMEQRYDWYVNFHCKDGSCSVLAEDFILDSEIAVAIKELSELLIDTDMLSESPFRYYEALAKSRSVRA